MLWHVDPKRADHEGWEKMDGYMRKEVKVGSKVRQSFNTPLTLLYYHAPALRRTIAIVYFSYDFRNTVK